MGKGEPLKKESGRVRLRLNSSGGSPAGGVDSLDVAAPVLQAVPNESLVHVQSLGGGDVPVPLVLDLSREPRFDDRSSP
jgi:hypothetical protein